MIETIRRFCREQALLSPGQRVICALSGGADSVALRHVPAAGILAFGAVRRPF